MSDLAIHTHGLVKSFGANRAVDGIDLAIPRGGVHGVLGPNGAGKTTTIRMLATLLKPDAGTATVLGFDVERDATEVRRHVGLTGQFASVDEDLTACENLRLIGRLFGYTGRAARRRAGDLLEAFGLTDAADRQAKKLSGGMRRRLDIAASIVVTPELLFLDEPTTGLDPRSRNEVWEIVRTMVLGGTTVLLTTQYLDEADRLADRISVIDHGAVVAEGTPAQLKSSVGAGSLVLRVADAAQRPVARAALERALGMEVRDGNDPLCLTAAVTAPATAAALGALETAGVSVTQLSYGQPSLDEVFLALTGRPTDQTETEEVAA